jgi:hypothetical protein
MTKQVSVLAEKISFNLNTGELWLPRQGEVYYTPDIKSVGAPVCEYVWSDNACDYMLLSTNRVHKTPDAALAQYELLQQIVVFFLKEA